MGESAPGQLSTTARLAAALTGAAVLATRGAARIVVPLGHVALHPPLVPERLHPGRALDALTDRGREALTSTGSDLHRLVAAVVPIVVNEVLDSLDLNALIREQVDLDGIVATVDIDAIVAQVDVAAIVSRVDINAIVAQVDIDAIVAQVDIGAIVDRLDIDAIVKGIDLDAIAERIDIERIIARVNIDAIVAGVDMNAIIGRIDLAGIAEDVINEIDLPEIIRDSTGTMASQVVREARMQSIDADEAVARLVDRVLRRRRARSTTAPHQPAPPSYDGPADDELPR
ncbi:MAG TPA: hypothetical protein VFB74_20240 [Kribbellaceae bacterium]|nr:hypothetical protein [Kribbellaceae bacterium]